MSKVNGIQSGEIIGDRYCILYELGRGRWSQTYLVREREGKCERGVLKLFTPVLPGGEAAAKATVRFENAARKLSRLQHPQLSKLKHFFPTSFRDRKSWCCVYECVEGLNYQEFLQLRWQHGRRFKEEEVIELLRQSLPILVYLHQKGMIHGDLALENIMQRQADKQTVFIDFGAFKQLVAILNPSDKKKRFYGGMAGYDAPERLRAGTAGPQSDLYALGAIAIALLSAREPQQLRNPESFSWDWSQIPASADFQEILQRMLAPESSDRFSDAGTTLEAVRALLWEPQSEAEPIALTQATVAEPIALTQATVAEPIALTQETVAPEIHVPPPSLVPSSLSEESEVPRTDSETDKSIEESLASALFSIEKPKSEPSSEVVSTVGSHKSRSRSVTTSRQVVRFQRSRVLVNLALVCAYSLGSGTAGWWASRLWIDRNAQLLASEGEGRVSQSKALNFLPADDPEPEPEASLPEAERERKLALRDRRLRSGLNYEFFTQLTNEFFWDTYPSQTGKTPSLAPEDSVWRERWDTIGTDAIARLEFLSLSARQRLGRYNTEERDSIVRAAASFKLSEKALFDVAEMLLAYHFPEIAGQTPQSSALLQIERATIADFLRSLRSQQSSAPITLAANEAESPSGTLQPGEVKVFFLQLEAGQTVSAILDADLSVSFAVYHPNGDRLLENSKLRSWSGRASENGIYTCILVSQSPVANAYNLSLTATASN
ncbi:serine/threonine-protein kinase [Oscillatoria sp. FACHB-1406]|uniref:serine/threonine protein kinase n=1 Tax=Oscillatoria sp. FACHB-1406 TaxID=2692846 RepID=UPI001684D16D|nr:serine/threonine-protein kinase [Oscillatoria sp. FACHB-1406]MBD2580112.1 serine/threonine protein kinase [Oscillatoria sp. FACHB-1406]